VVADDPFQGTAYLYALSGTRMLFPQVEPGVNNPNLTYLAQHLVHLSRDQRACSLVRQYGVGYMVFEPDDYLHKVDLPGFYVGATNPAPGSGFQLVAADGPNKLYKITICQPAGQPGGQVTAGSPGSR